METKANHWQDRRVFVTGVTGLLGGWLVKRLLSVGADIVCLVRDWIPDCEFKRSEDILRVKVVTGDVCKQELLERILGEYEIDTVFHLAAQTIVTIANRNPISTFETNIGGVWKLLEACRRNPTVKSIVIASSDKAYGDQDNLPYTEDTPLQGKHPYDVSKSCADLIAHTYAVSYGLPVAIARCGNLYGGGDLNWNRIIPGTIRSILRGQQPVIRSDGQYTRDYFDVEDAVSAYMRLAERTGINNGEAFNFSNEKPCLTIAMVCIILDLMNSSLIPLIQRNTNNEIREQYLSAQKAHDRLNWYAEYTLDMGLKKTIAWYRNYFEEKQWTI
jgi:CDP-glucose 4,6-dehydratase